MPSAQKRMVAVKLPRAQACLISARVTGPSLPARRLTECLRGLGKGALAQLQCDACPLPRPA